mmetsp:Transcript_29812/g.69331  ORF Transcript_29812/g.69331 Transcript_29812/m.69331 type:complete len:253 (+) Transcript_29812:961-1719(+)
MTVMNFFWARGKSSSMRIAASCVTSQRKQSVCEMIVADLILPTPSMASSPKTAPDLFAWTFCVDWKSSTSSDTLRSLEDSGAAARMGSADAASITKAVPCTKINIEFPGCPFPMILSPGIKTRSMELAPSRSMNESLMPSKNGDFRISCMKLRFSRKGPSKPDPLSMRLVAIFSTLSRSLGKSCVPVVTVLCRKTHVLHVSRALTLALLLSTRPSSTSSPMTFGVSLSPLNCASTRPSFMTSTDPFQRRCIQ